jgi:hypothetical protein
MRRLLAVRYLNAFREGGSLPGLVETDDGRLFVVKLRGAGQGTRALVAELLAGELARALGLPVPEIALVSIEPGFGATERDEEVRDLLRASAGVNLGLELLPGAMMFDPAARDAVDDELASRTVALDAFVMNVDRTARNPNLLWWRGGLWLIDHGAALLWHHRWDGGVDGAARPFPLLRQHVLLPWARSLAADAGRWAAELARLDDALLARVAADLPADWLAGGPDAGAYVAFLAARRDGAARYLDLGGAP